MYFIVLYIYIGKLKYLVCYEEEIYYVMLNVLDVN